MNKEREVNIMLIASCQIKLIAPWVHSLKEKRMIIKSLLAKLRNQFNVTVAEIDCQDIHQTIVIGIAAIVANRQVGDSTIDHILDFIEESTEAEIIDVIREID